MVTSVVLQRCVSLLAVAMLAQADNRGTAESRLDELSRQGMAALGRQDYGAAIAALREGSQAARGAGLKRRAALFENAVCGARFAAMDFGGSLRSCGEAVSIALEAGEAEIAGIAELNRSNFLFSLGDTTGAEIGLRQALSLLKANSGYRPVALATLGVVTGQRGEKAMARATLQEAAELASASPDRSTEAYAQSSLGALELSEGRLAEAEAALLASYRIRRLHRLPQLEVAWRQLGELRLAQKRTQEAVEYLRRALEARTYSRANYVSFLTWEAMGRAYREMGDRERAREALRRALEEASPWREVVAPSEGLEIAADVRLARLAASFAAVSAPIGRESWEAFEAVESRRAAGLRRQILVNRAWGGRLTAEHVELVRVARNLHRRALGGEQGAAAELRGIELRLRRLEMESGVVPNSGNEAGGSAGAVERLARALEPDQVLISFLVDSGESRVWVVSGEGKASAALPDAATLAQAVERQRAAIQAGEDGREEGEKLYQLLFSGIPGRLLRKPRWSVVADGALWSAPWSALVADWGEGRRYLVESKSLELIPSATWLLGPKEEAGTGGMLAAGHAIHNRADARFRGESAAEAVGLSYWVWPWRAPGQHWEPIELPGLAGSQRELKGACGAWTAGPCTVLSGAQLTVENLSKEIARRPAVVHLATHLLSETGPYFGRMSPDLGQYLQAIPAYDEAFLALSLRPDLTRENLRPRDVSRLFVPDALVVLSACGSGQGAKLPGAGLQGFSRAWLAAGARGVVSTLWPVPDETGEFFSRFYGEISNGKWAAGALRSAQLHALSRNGWRSKPRFWAAYMMLGKD